METFFLNASCVDGFVIQTLPSRHKFKSLLTWRIKRWLGGGGAFTPLLSGIALEMRGCLTDQRIELSAVKALKNRSTLIEETSIKHQPGWLWTLMRLRLIPLLTDCFSLHLNTINWLVTDTVMHARPSGWICMNCTGGEGFTKTPDLLCDLVHWIQRERPWQSPHNRCLWR